MARLIQTQQHADPVTTYSTTHPPHRRPIYFTLYPRVRTVASSRVAFQRANPPGMVVALCPTVRVTMSSSAPKNAGRSLCAGGAQPAPEPIIRDALRSKCGMDFRG